MKAANTREADTKKADTKKAASRLHHIALYVADIQDKMNLLKNVFGMRITEVDGSLDHPNQVWFDGGIQLISQPESKVCAIAHVALTSGELASQAENLEKFGANTLPGRENWLHFPDHLLIELMPEEDR